MKPTAIYIGECSYTKESLEAIAEAFDVFVTPSLGVVSTEVAMRTEVMFAPAGFRVGPVGYPRLKYLVQNRTYTGDMSVPNGVEIISLAGHQTVLEAITSTAEHTLGLIHAAHRLIPAAGRDITKKARWDRYSWAAPKMLSRMTLGIVGLGRVGQHLLERAEHLFADVVWYDPAIDRGLATAPDSLETLAARSDVLSINAGPRQGKMPICNVSILDKLPKDAIVINTARPGLLDESYLLLLMKQGRIRAAALDCINWELDKSKPLMLDPLVQYAKDHDNLILTPHIAGSTLDAWRETEMAVIEQVKERYA